MQGEDLASLKQGAVFKKGVWIAYPCIRVAARIFIPAASIAVIVETSGAVATRLRLAACAPCS